MKKYILLIISIVFVINLQSQCPWYISGTPSNTSTYYYNNFQSFCGITTVFGCGIILDSLDFIGAFIDSANTGHLKCVGYRENDGVSNINILVGGNSPASPWFFYGPEPGDTLIWKVWDNSENQEYFIEIPFLTNNFCVNYGIVYIPSGEHLIDTIRADIFPLPAYDYLIASNEVTFINNSKSHINCIWDFGDGDTSVLENPVHFYDSNGVFTVTLTISNDCHTIDTSFQVKIEAFAEAYFEYSISGKEVTFDNLSNYATNYLWNFGDSNNSVEENPIHNFAEDGIYVVNLKAINSLSDSIYTDTIEIETSGIEEFGSFEIVYPNPNLGKFQISLNRKCQKISIFDCLGTEIFQQNISNGETQVNIDISLHPASIYFIKLFRKNCTHVLKFIKY
ncbi:MAG: PKD domain-containing protein [Bacteroidetes bacterium]|nr:PKD domain-containing protein [Bacteroidota bacterium]